MDDLLKPLEEEPEYRAIFTLQEMSTGQPQKQFAKEMAEGERNSVKGLKEIEKIYRSDFKERLENLMRLLNNRSDCAKRQLLNLTPEQKHLQDYSETVREKIKALKHDALRNLKKSHSTPHMFWAMTTMYVLGILAGAVLFIYTFEYAFPDLPSWIGWVASLPTTVAFSFLMKVLHKLLDVQGKKRFLKILAWTGAGVLVLTQIAMFLAKLGTFDELSESASLQNLQLLSPTDPSEEKTSIDLSGIAFGLITMSELLVVSVFGISALDEYDALKDEDGGHDRNLGELKDDLTQNDADLMALTTRINKYENVQNEINTVLPQAQSRYLSGLGQIKSMYKKQLATIVEEDRTTRELEDRLRKRQKRLRGELGDLDLLDKDDDDDDELLAGGVLV